MGRRFLLGACAILVLAGALAAVVWRLTVPGPPAPVEPPPPVAGSAPAPQPAPGAPPVDPAPVRSERLPEPRPAGRQGRTPGELFTGLGPLGASVARCTARSTSASGSPRHAVLVLDLQPQQGAVTIVGAAPLQRTGESDALARCALSELVGREVPLASARPGRPYRMSYSVSY